jgi:hypothetical protein
MEFCGSICSFLTGKEFSKECFYKNTINFLGEELEEMLGSI